jgi:hypothetical protein
MTRDTSRALVAVQPASAVKILLRLQGKRRGAAAGLGLEHIRLAVAVALERAARCGPLKGLLVLRADERVEVANDS